MNFKDSKGKDGSQDDGRDGADKLQMRQPYLHDTPSYDVIDIQIAEGDDLDSSSEIGQSDDGMGGWFCIKTDKLLQI